MITRVLIAEDHESANISVQRTLEDLNIVDFKHVHYCDEALGMITQLAGTDKSFDLLITDLYFEPDSRKQSIAGGAELIKAARQIQPDLKILVFSGEDRSAIIDMLYSELDIDGYVRKARNDAKELKLAITEIGQRRRFQPRHIRDLIIDKNGYEFSEYEITIISLLANGMLQKEIPSRLLELKIKPAGLSSLEKRLNHMKETLNLTTNEQLVAFCKDRGII